MELIAIWIFIFSYIINGVIGQEVYIGRLIGKLNSYHNQVNGEVYAVDASTILIKEFTYDGNGEDAFFWAGSNPRPGPNGFIVPNEYGRTNVLGPYLGKDITISLVDGKTINDIKWLAVFDISRLESFGDVFIYEGFEPPQSEPISDFNSKSKDVSSGAVTIIDSKTIEITNFNFNGKGKNSYFWVGVGQEPNSKGQKIPDEHGYMTPLRHYVDDTITLTLPGDKTVFTVKWLAVYDLDTQTIAGSVIIPEELNVPPALVTIKDRKVTMPNCEQLYKDLQIRWEIFGDQVTLEIVAQMGDDDYAAFGISGDPVEPKMIGGDVVVAYREDYSGFINDYNMSSYFQCTKTVGQYRGVCKDDKVGGAQDYQYHTSSRDEGVSIFRFRRRLATPDTGDRPYPESGPSNIIWALGRLDEQKRPTMHYAWSNVAQTLTFSRNPAENNCFSFTQNRRPKLITPWPTYKLTNVHNIINASLGPNGGPRGYIGTTGQTPSSGSVWYINGQLAPELILKRDRQYKMQVQGGTNPYDPAGYHPMIITDEPHGEYSQLKEEDRSSVRVFAGIDYTVSGEPRSSRGSAGPLCLWKHYPHQDRRRDVEYPTFESFRNSLFFDCDATAKPGILHLRPNRSWPDVVYYNSWTGKNMGGKIYIINSSLINQCSPTLLFMMLIAIFYTM